MFGQDDRIAIVLSELKNLREEVDFKDLGDDLGIGTDCVNVLEDVDKPLDSPMPVFRRNIPAKSSNEIRQGR